MWNKDLKGSGKIVDVNWQRNLTGLTAIFPWLVPYKMYFIVKKKKKSLFLLMLSFSTSKTFSVKYNRGVPPLLTDSLVF